MYNRSILYYAWANTIYNKSTNHGRNILIETLFTSFVVRQQRRTTIVEHRQHTRLNFAISMVPIRAGHREMGDFFSLSSFPMLEVFWFFPVKRDIGISYCRLLLHDTMLKYDSYKTGTSSSPICDCGSGEYETTEHFLIRCSNYTIVSYRIVSVQRNAGLEASLSSSLYHTL